MNDYSWYAMPEQQHQYGRGTNPGRGYGGEEDQPGGAGRDTGWDQPGGQWGGSGDDPSRTAARERARQASARSQSRRDQLSRLMGAQHRNRRTRGLVDPTTGLSELTSLEMSHELETQQQAQDRREVFSSIVGALMGFMTGIPGLAGLTRGFARRGREDRIDAAMDTYEETGELTARPGPAEGGDRGPSEGSPTEVPGREKVKKPPPGGPADPPEEPEEELDEYDKWWLENFGINPNDPRLRDPSFDPGNPGTPAASQSAQRRDLQGPGGNPTLAYMQMVNRDIQRGRQQYAAMNRQRGRMRLGGPQ